MLSIIIVNYKSSKDLDICLSSIIKNEKSYGTYEFIVVDNDSNDMGLNEIILKYPFVKILNAPKNGGFAYGNNIGIKNSKGDIILLLNPDTWIEEPAISKLLYRLRSDEKLDIIGPQLFFADGRNQSYYLPKTYLNLWRLFCEQFYLHRVFRSIKIFNSYFKTYMNFSIESNVEQVSGAAFMMKRRVIDQIGMLDEDYFMYFEESDFCLKAVKKGMKLLYYPYAKIIHKGGLTDSSKSSFTTLRFYNSFKIYFNKNFSMITCFSARIILFVGTLLRYIFLKVFHNKKYMYYQNLLKNILTFQL